MLPSKFIVDYTALLSSESGDRGTLGVLLCERLPIMWRDAYLRTIRHEPNLVRFRHRSFEYVCDLYSQLEMMGSVPYDQTVVDRVVGVFGTSSRVEQNRNTRRARIELSEELEGTARDDGHFMARSIGGGVDVNLFSQDRLLNRGWSSQGKIYRQMEKYCRDQEGTFCFSRPILHRWLARPALARIRCAEERRDALGRGFRQLSEIN